MGMATKAQDHYDILNISPNLFSDTEQNEKIIKLAYRRALLQQHPDRSDLHSSKRNYSVDQIILAYKTLIDPATRCDYDRFRASKPRLSTLAHVSVTGLETIDLDDLSYDEAQAVWYRSCRCGLNRSYVLSEQDLDMNAERGEIVAGCPGCSIWLRVTFATDDGP